MKQKSVLTLFLSYQAEIEQRYLRLKKCIVFKTVKGATLWQHKKNQKKVAQCREKMEEVTL